MDDHEVALVLPEPGALALLEDDAQAAKEFAREALSPALTSNRPIEDWGKVLEGNDGLATQG